MAPDAQPGDDLLPGENLPRGGILLPAGDLQATDDLPPSEEELRGMAPDDDGEPPAGVSAWLADLPADDLGDDLDWPACVEPPEALPAGLLPRSYGYGAGFASGGVADRLAPGPALAGFAAGAWADRLGRITDDELVGVLLAWRRLNSWTAAGELAAVAELSRRRDAEVAAGADPHLAEHVGDELAVALTLTARAADDMLQFAGGLSRLPLTRTALARGDIDRHKASIIADGVACLDR